MVVIAITLCFDNMESPQRADTQGSGNPSASMREPNAQIGGIGDVVQRNLDRARQISFGALYS
jgi:hypothetical protein